jgi:cation diffusion facilitator family transporter
MQTDKENVAFGSIAASAGLTLAKGAVGLMTGSLAILSEAAHSLLDLVATIMTYFAVRISGKPADEEHHYGHGKVESVTALVTTGMLFVLSAAVIWEAGKRLFGKEAPVEATAAAFIVMLVSIAVDYWRSRLLNRVARDTSSEALEADALHFSSDMWSSLAVLVGLGGLALGFPWADAAAALVVALFILLAGWRLAKRTIDTLTDTAPPGSASQLTEIASRVPGVVAIERVRARQVGQQLFVELTAAISRTLPMDRVTAIKDAVTHAIHAQHSNAEVSITTHPRALDDETILERVNVIARNRALAVHHVTVQNLQGKLSVSLDLEVAGNLSLGAAHEIADRLEHAIEEELGNDVEVETHIEPLQTADLSGRDAPPTRVREVEMALTAIAKEIGTIRQVHDVRVRETGDGEIVNFHCRVDPEQTVHDIHEKVDDLERALRERWPSIRRVIGHAEPLPSDQGMSTAAP